MDDLEDGCYGFAEEMSEGEIVKAVFDLSWGEIWL